MANPVTFFEILGQDVEKLTRFYREAFAWNIADPSVIGYRLVEPAGEGGIAGGIGKAQQGAGWVTFYVTVPDVSAALASIERLGGTIVTPATTLPTGFTLGHAADPEGHVIGLVQG